MFELPEFIHDSVRSASLRACTLQTLPSPQACFYSDPANRLICVLLSTITGLLNFVIDVPACTLTRYIAAHPVQPGAPTVVVPWEAWGTHGARVTVSTGTARFGTISGSRRVTACWPSGADGHGVLTVLDYCPRRVARAIARGTAPVLHGAEVGVEFTGADFGPLRTTLPCIATETQLPDGIAQGRDIAWICENGILFAQVRLRSIRC
ncbi:hypothetical protein BV25DRAFT_1581334 [Artomyces pyxidatus]|uniref:Uncharacterized protein n=1 Tax=Artomyces pyxidatus TaxID=48021 RepID=A0ACB8TAZ1_9AGAM|nr:hypothetical protein BV25DRAFT_1581334 [Artomyces pyxidatus]